MSSESSAGAVRVTTPWLAALVILSVVSVLLELHWGIPVKLPGHRALPGALALLVAAESLAPWMLLVYSIAMPLVITALGGGEPALIVPWLGLALLLVAVANTRWRNHFWFMVVAGLAYGALRFGVLLLGPHPTPQFVRVVGHLLFGGLGGLLAAIAVKTQRRHERSTKERGT